MSQATTPAAAASSASSTHHQADDDELTGADSGLGVGEATGAVEVTAVGVGVGAAVVGVTDSSGVSGVLEVGTGVGVEVTEKVLDGVATLVGAPVFEGAADVGADVGAVVVGSAGDCVGRLVADEIALLAWLASDDAADSRSLLSGRDTSPQPESRAAAATAVRAATSGLRRMAGHYVGECPTGIVLLGWSGHSAGGDDVPPDRVAWWDNCTGGERFRLRTSIQGKRAEDAEDDLVNQASETNKCQYSAH